MELHEQSCLPSVGSKCTREKATPGLLTSIAFKSSSKPMMSYQQRKTQFSFSCCRPRTYALVHNSVKLAAPQDKTLREILDILGRHYASTPPTEVQRFYFNSRGRFEGEVVSDFAAALKCLAEHCRYETEPDNMLRD